MTADAHPVLVLWDIDHTLIENGGVSKLNYALAFELLTGQAPAVGAATQGRTDVEIMDNLFSANGADPPADRDELLSALGEAGRRNAPLLSSRGHALPGAREALERLASSPGVINSVLTGNIEANARLKLGAFGLDIYIDFSAGAFGAEHRVRSQLVPVAQAKARDLYGFDPLKQPTILVGDTERDVRAGLDGGARVIAVATGTDAADLLVAAGADVVLPGLSDLEAFWAAFDDVRALGPAEVRV